jgi:EmrB/QacA subfamily drug resistance transporter
VTASGAGPSGSALGERLVSRRASLATLLAVLFLTFLDTTIVSVTLGNLETDISVGVLSLQWVINAYALTFASLMLVGGALGDRFGRRRVMAIGIVIFCVGSLVCALASGATTVIVGRAVMGAGAAAAEPGTLSLIRQLHPDRAQRARALGAWSAVAGLALAFGPVIGGVLVGAGSWRTVFWFNLALGLVVLGAVLITVPESRAERTGRLDVGGFVLASAGIGCVIYAAITGEYHGYAAASVIVLFVVGVACLVAFGVVESRIADPLVQPRFVRPPMVRAALFAATASYFAVFAIFFLVALYLDVGLRYSGWKLAGMFAPMAVAIVLGSIVAGRVVGRVGSRVPMASGLLISAVGIVASELVLTRHGALAFGPLAATLAVAGLGFGVTVVPLTSAVLSHIPAEYSGVAASLTNTARQLGAVIGVTLLGAVVNAQLKNGISAYLASLPFGSTFRGKVVSILENGGSNAVFSLDKIPAPFVHAFVDGLRIALFVAAALTLLAAAVTVAVRDVPEPD